MKFTIRKTLTIAFLSAGVLIGYSCGDLSDDKDSKKSSEDRSEATEVKEEAKIDILNEKDSKGVVNAYTSNLYEIKLAETAKTHATTDEAKSLASAMFDAHSKLNTQLRELAIKKQIDLPSDITPEQQEKINDLAKKKPKNFDKEYAELMVNKHKDAIDMYENCANECTDQDIRSWFASAVPELRKHLDMAKSSEEKLKEMKK
jgi:putative membrane protein